MPGFKKNLFFITLIIIPFVSGILYGFDGALIGILITLLICILFIIINADKFILLLYRARPAIEGELPGINEKIRGLSKKHGIPAPYVYFTELGLPGSFIIGRSPHKTYIVFPKRLLIILESQGVEAILAHNIVQIDNNIRKRTIAALIAGALTMSSSLFRWGAALTGFGDFNDPAPKLFGLFVTGLAAPPAAALIQSISKEDYDAKALKLLDNPDAFICAISQLESNNVTAYSSLGFLCFIDPKKENFVEHLFGVHPPTQVRIKNLTSKGEKT